jgi:hypothetical protein
VRRHHAKGFLDPQVECTAHAQGNMPAQGTEATRHGTPGLRLALLDALARLESHDLERFQLLLGGVVGRLDCLRLGHRRPESRPQAWKQEHELS